MTVTLHLPANPADRSVMVRRVRTLAADPGQVRSGNGGLVVPDALALAYLTGDQPAPAVLELHPPSVELARVVRTAEGHAGLLEPRPDAPAPDPPPRTRTAARRPRRTTAQQGAATS